LYAIRAGVSTRVAAPSKIAAMTEPELELDRYDTDPEAMRRAAHQALDLIIDHISGLSSEPAWNVLPRAEGETRLREPVPETGTPLEVLLPRLRNDVLEHRARVGHPRFFAFIPSAPTFPSVLGDVLAAGFNPFVGTWLGGSGPSMLELVVLDWFREMLGLPETTGGLLTSGGSSATIMAFVAARHALLDDDVTRAVIYASSETHSAVERAAWITGFSRGALRKLPADASYRLEPDRLRAAIGEDRARGLRPFMIVGNAGTTNTGAVDPLAEMGRLAREEQLWFHIDGAYGGFAALSARGRELLSGLETADSWVLDPHKWLYQGIECGSVLLRRPDLLRDAFHIMPDYLQDIDRGDAEPNFADRGLQLSRNARALKVWLSVKAFGLGAFRRAVDRSLDLALLAERTISEHHDFEVLSPAGLGIVTFRIVPRGGRFTADDLNRAVLDRLNASGYAFLSSTRIRGCYALRFCILSHRTTAADVTGVLARLIELARDLEGGVD
ncbi:MAG TPA: aminotransferase class V-fold PLP-dependent enzyme, partial [Dongiaceae bacterium]|nr:aminotransferase class V-fold PLP-dependent enzyme [Dongiaceae bacterium]